MGVTTGIERYASALSREEIVDRLRRVGIPEEDPRVRRVLGEPADADDAKPMTANRFAAILEDRLIGRALRGELAIADFAGFTAELTDIYEGLLADRRGRVADYIPALKSVDPDQFAVSVCTVDGQRFSVGDSGSRFCVQSVCKPVNYGLALEERGPELVHRHVGHEPSGRRFNALALTSDGLPHNPMINSGAIMCCSLIGPHLDPAARFDKVLRTWQKLAGTERVGFDEECYRSEERTADRNFALGYWMQEMNAFPANTELMETLAFYLKCCSIEMDAEGLGAAAAALANGGLSPVTGERVFSAASVQKCLSMMSACGMYDYSGEFAFSVGLPAKSGVSGALMVVVPRVMGICLWSPRLDIRGNSVRGIEFCRELVSRFPFHVYDNLDAGRGMEDAIPA